MGHNADSTCNCRSDSLTKPGGPLEQFHLFVEGDDLYASMLAAMANAKHCIKLESYIFADDAVGQKFSQVLMERASAGVAVQVHIDAAGSLFWFSRRMQNQLRHKGVQLRWFHRWNWRQPWRYNRRNHRKLLVVDNDIAFLGGFNIHKENSLAYYGEMRWRDTHVSFHGALVDEASRLFDAFWIGHLRWLPEQKNSGSKLLHTHTASCRHLLRCVYIAEFASAKKSIYLTTPYFAPDRHMLKHLCRAAERGVDVKILVPRRGNMRLVRWAARHIYAQLLMSGVQIFEYLPRMLHAKIAVVDQDWSMLGTANLDYRSLFINYEVNLISTNGELAAELRQQFMNDLAESEQIELEVWKKRGWISAGLEKLAALTTPWL